MSTFLRSLRILFTGSLLLLLTSCGEPVEPSTSTPAVDSATDDPRSTPPDAWAVVNGAAITRADMTLAMATAGHKEDYSPERSRRVLEDLIEDELIAQDAERLGHAHNREYLEKLGKLEAQVKAFKRQALGEVYFREEVRKKARVTEEQTTRYFGENEQRIRTELHIKQILRKSQPEIDATQARLQAGEDFDAVAASRFTGATTEGRQPWDLGHLKWTQIPAAWHAAVEQLADGEVSGVLSNPSGRFWIIQIVERRVNADITLEQMAPVIESLLEKETIDARRSELKAARRAAASIKILPGAGEPILPPAAPDEEP
jgi:peptidyl-prolyl cis-trans isomerase C